MTALKKYQRLEASGLWRPSPDDQRREVIVSIGDATLTISDLNDRALAHWSLAAIERLNPGARPAIFHPDGDPGETLELAADEAEMIDAIERLRRAIARARPQQGRLRRSIMLTTMAILVGLAVFWLPDALRRQAVGLVPPATRQEIGTALLQRIQRVAGRPCQLPEATGPLQRLARRTGVAQLVVLREGIAETLLLPGGVILINRSLIEGYEDPAVVAGFILAERARASHVDPLRALLDKAGLIETVRLLTTGALTRAALDRYAETILARPRPGVPEGPLLALFAASEIPSTPYAQARGQQGEPAPALLIDADPMAGRSFAPVLPDSDWVRLQNICL